ncbi:MAG: hypothetical protein VX519_10355 [Myxococcota bacterium]|nr:hypothetical protein [Myxococcota bacterium]
MLWMCSGCGDDSGSALDSAVLDTSESLEVVDEVDTQTGFYHLELSYAPDPPVLGEGSMEVRITFVNSNPDLQGAAVVGANVSLQGQHTDLDVALDAPINLVESSLGAYQSNVTWPEAGLWALTVEVGAAERTDVARFGVRIEAE